MLGGLLRDILALLGLAATGYGLWQIYEPACWIFGGAATVMLALLGERHAVKPDSAKPRQPRKP